MSTSNMFVKFILLSLWVAGSWRSTKCYATTYADRPMAFDGDVSLFAPRYLGFGRYSVTERSVTDGHVLNEYWVPGSVETIAFNKRNKLLLAAGDGSISIWDLKDSTVIQRQSSVTSHIHDGQFSPNGDYLALAHDCGTLEIRSQPSGKHITSVTIDSDSLISACVDNSGSWAIASGLTSTYLVEIKSRHYREILPSPSESLRMFEDGTHAAINYDDSKGLRTSIISLDGLRLENFLLNESCGQNDIRICGPDGGGGIVALIETQPVDEEAHFVPAILRKDCTIVPVPIDPGGGIFRGSMPYRAHLTSNGLIAGFVSFNGNVWLHSFKTNSEWNLESIDSSDGKIIALAVTVLVSLAIGTFLLFRRKRV